MANRTKIWALGIGVLSVVLLLLGVFAGLMPQLQDYRTTNQLADDTEFRNETQRQINDRLAEQERNMAALEEERRELKVAIPATAMGEGKLRDIQRIADATGASVKEFIAQEPVPYGGESATATASPTEGEGDAELEGETTAIPAEAPQASARGLVAIPVILSVTGSYDQVIEFMREFQASNRLLELHNVIVYEEPQKSDTFQGDLSGLMFSKPDQ